MMNDPITKTHAGAAAHEEGTEIDANRIDHDDVASRQVMHETTGLHAPVNDNASALEPRTPKRLLPPATVPLPGRPPMACYNRVSATGVNDTSIQRQTELAQEYADRIGGDLCFRFDDHALTGTTMHGRDALSEMLAAAKAGLFVILTVECIDRLARDQEHLHHIWKRLNHYGVSLHESTGGKVDRANLSMKGLMSEAGREQFLFRTAKGREASIRAGRSPHRPAFGLAIDNRRRGGRIIHAERAAVVRQIFADFLEGTSIVAIAQALTGVHATPGDCSGIDTGRYEADRKSAWTTNMVRQILRNVVYTGTLLDGVMEKLRDPDTRVVIGHRMRPQSEWRVNDVPSCRIVSVDDFAQVQTKMDANFFGGRKVVPFTRYLLTGKAFCVCGGRLVVKAYYDRLFFHCAGGSGCDGRRRLEMPLVERAVLAALDEHVCIDAAADAFRQEYETVRAGLQAAADRTRDELEAKRRKAVTLLENTFLPDVMAGFSTERTAAFRAKLEAELLAIENELAQHRARPPLMQGHTASSIRDAVRLMMEQVPNRGRDAASRRLVGTFRDLVARVTLSKAAPDGSATVAILVDLGARGGAPVADEGDNPSRFKTVDVTVGTSEQRQTAVAKARARRSDDMVALYDAAGGDLPDGAWNEAGDAIAHVSTSIGLHGWSPRGLADAVRFRICAGKAPSLPDRFGPAATFDEAARILIVSGGLDALAARLADTPSAIPFYARFMASTRRPSLGDAAFRRRLYDDLSGTPVDDLLNAVAMRLDGWGNCEVAKHLGIPRSVAATVWNIFLERGEAGLRCDDLLLRRAPLEPEQLLACAGAARNPDLELRLRVVAAIDTGSSTSEIAQSSGLTKRTVRQWAAAHRCGGPLALAAHCWRPRKRPIIAGPVASAAADGAQGRAAALEGHAKRRMLALSLFLSGAALDDVLRRSGESELAVKAVTRIYMRRGFAGFDGGDGRPTFAAELAEDAGQSKPLQIVAAFLDDHGASTLARRYGISAENVKTYAEAWLSRGSSAFANAAAAISADEIKTLNDLIEAGVDPDDPCRPINTRVIQRICRQRFGLVLLPLAVYRLCYAKGLKMRGPAPRALSRNGHRAAGASTLFEDDGDV